MKNKETKVILNNKTILKSMPENKELILCSIALFMSLAMAVAPLFCFMRDQTIVFDGKTDSPIPFYCCVILAIAISMYGLSRCVNICRHIRSNEYFFVEDTIKELKEIKNSNDTTQYFVSFEKDSQIESKKGRELAQIPKDLYNKFNELKNEENPNLQTYLLYVNGCDEVVGFYSTPYYEIDKGTKLLECVE